MKSEITFQLTLEKMPKQSSHLTCFVTYRYNKIAAKCCQPVNVLCVCVRVHDSSACCYSTKSHKPEMEKCYHLTVMVFCLMAEDVIYSNERIQRVTH